MVNILLPILLVVLSFQARASAAPQLLSLTETHGGDATGIEALSIISQILTDVQNASFTAGLNKEFSTQFNLGLGSHLGEVYGTDLNLNIDGRVKTAINQISAKDPRRKDILIQNADWRPLNQNSRYRLLLHELLLVSGYKDLDYTASLKLFAYLECAFEQSRAYQDNYRSNAEEMRRLGLISSEFVIRYCGRFDADFERF